MSEFHNLMAACGGGWKKTPHNLTDFHGPGFIVSQSSDIDDERLAWRAMDGDLRAEGHEAHTAGDGVEWWGIDFDRRVALKQLVWKWRRKEDGSINDESGWGDAKKDVVLQGSDGEAWTDVREITHPGVGDLAVELGGTPPFCFWRLLSRQEWGYLIIGELEFTYREV